MVEYLERNEFQTLRAYSPAVITQGGRIVWLAGQTATRGERGEDISGRSTRRSGARAAASPTW
jgi:enamine deaminase RidA (YjgF/YER057c/UK114 family)